MINGTIFNIQRFCTDDGLGIRTTVFLKGCPLNCIWCHNPESLKSRSEILYDKNKCANCGACVSVCPKKCHIVDKSHTFIRRDCIGCGACETVCNKMALELYGKRVSVGKVFEEIKKDKVFYDTSGGGITISGGEPLFQPKFTLELLKVCKENGIHTAIETSGFASESVLRSVIKYCDFILYDIKETNEELHMRYTGVSLNPILNNLAIVNENKTPFIIRAPIIPTLNDRKEHFGKLKEIYSSMNFCQGIQIMPYHKTGAHKYELIGKPYACSNILEPTNEMIKSWEKIV